jgi:putative transposase
VNFEYFPQFFTATILNWKLLLKYDTYKLIVVNSLSFLAQEKRVKIYAYVIMPNHIHLIWQVNDNYKIEKVQQSFLKYTAQQIKFDLQKNNPTLLEEFWVNAKDRDYQFWERNALSIDLYSDKFFEQK